MVFFSTQRKYLSFWNTFCLIVAFSVNLYLQLCRHSENENTSSEIRRAVVLRWCLKKILSNSQHSWFQSNSPTFGYSFCKHLCKLFEELSKSRKKSSSKFSSLTLATVQCFVSCSSSAPLVVPQWAKIAFCKMILVPNLLSMPGTLFRPVTEMRKLRYQIFEGIYHL